MGIDDATSLDELVTRARDHQRRSEHALAITHFDAAINALSANNPTHATLLNDRAFSKVMSGKDHYDAAFADNQVALVYAQDSDQKARALVDMSYIQRVGYNNVPVARNSLSLAARIATPNSFFHAKAMEFEGRTYQGSTEFERMTTLYGKATEIYRTLLTQEPEDQELLKRLGETAHLLGLVYLDQGTFDEALAAQEESLRISIQAGNNMGIYLATRTAGRIEYARGNAAAALPWYNRALAALGPNPPQRNFGSLALNQAQAHLALEQPARALEYWTIFTKNVFNGNVTENDLKQLQPAVIDAIAQAETRGIDLSYIEKVRL